MDVRKAGLGKRQTPRNGDYYNKEGVLVCGVCGKEREWHGFFPGVGMTWAACICDCDKKRYVADIEAENLAQKKRLANMRREHAFPFGSFLVNMTLDKDDKLNNKVSEAVRQYCRNFEKALKESRGLVFMGDVGTGKTFFAAAILNAAIDEGYKCLFTSFPQEINEMANTYDKNEYLKNLKSYDFVVFDDFGVERETEFNLEQMYQIVNARYLVGKPTIITTNMGNAAFGDANIDKQRIFSRIFEKADIIVVSGADRRKTKKTVIV
jgi:DNA replication protein DnaC